MKKKVTAKSKMNKALALARANSKTVHTIGLFLKAVSELYRLDPTTPGLSLAWLPDKKVYYASFCRYEARLGENKQVMTNSTSITIDEAITKLAQNWYDEVPSGRELRDFVRKSRNPLDYDEFMHYLPDEVE